MPRKVRPQPPVLLVISFFAFCIPSHAQIAQPQTGSIAIDTYNGLAVTADPFGLVQIFNVDDPPHPAFLSKLSVPDQLTSVALAGNYVLAGGQGGVHVLDISNPRYPALISLIPLKAKVAVVKAAGNLGYGAFGNTLILFDIPSCTLIDQRSYSTLPIAGIAMCGDYLYVLSAAVTGRASYVVTKVAIQNYLDTAVASFNSPAAEQSDAGRMSIYAAENTVYIGGVDATASHSPRIEILHNNGSTLSTAKRRFRWGFTSMSCAKCDARCTCGTSNSYYLGRLAPSYS